MNIEPETKLFDSDIRKSMRASQKGIICKKKQGDGEWGIPTTIKKIFHKLLQVCHFTSAATSVNPPFLSKLLSFLSITYNFFVLRLHARILSLLNLSFFSLSHFHGLFLEFLLGKIFVACVGSVTNQEKSLWPKQLLDRTDFCFTQYWGIFLVWIFCESILNSDDCRA